MREMINWRHKLLALLIKLLVKNRPIIYNLPITMQDGTLNALDIRNCLVIECRGVVGIFRGFNETGVY